MVLPSANPAVRFTSDEAWLDWRAEEDSVGGSQVPVLLGLHAFKNPIAASASNAGHILEPLVLARAARIRRWEQVEQGWGVRHVTETWRRGSLDALALLASVAVLVVEIKVVFLGQFALWRDGLPDHVLLQALWYQDLTGLPVVVVALMVPAWGLGDQDPATVAECSEIRFYDLPLDLHAERRALLVDAVREVRAGRLVVPPFQAPAPEPVPQGSLDDGVLAAQWLQARAAARDAVDHARAARAASRAATARYEDLSNRLRSRVGLGGSLLAGGWRVSVGLNGAIRAR